MRIFVLERWIQGVCIFLTGTVLLGCGGRPAKSMQNDTSQASTEVALDGVETVEPRGSEVDTPTPFAEHTPALDCQTRIDGMDCQSGGAQELDISLSTSCLVGTGSGPSQTDQGHHWLDTFYVDQGAVLEEDYERCHRSGVCPPKNSRERASDMWPREPVQGVTLEGARAYCHGLGKRLLTREEWAAIGGCTHDGINVLRCGLTAAAQMSHVVPPFLPYALELSKWAEQSRLQYRLPKRAKRGRKTSNSSPVRCKEACTEGRPWLVCDPAFIQTYGLPPKETDSGFVIDDTYKDNHRVHAILSGYHRKYPEVTRLVSLGTTHQGRSIWALRVTDQPDRDEDEPALLLNGAHHGDEFLSVDYTLDALQQILERQDDPLVRRYIREFDLWFVPLVNPDGNYTTLHRSCGPNAGRKNGRDLNQDGLFEVHEGVDLNRNYPFRWHFLGEKGSKSDPKHSRYRGDGPASEPETQIMMRLAQRYHFLAALTWHTNAKKILSPYTIRKVKNTKPDVAWLVAETLRDAMNAPRRHAFKVAKDLYAVDGVDQDWHFHTHGTLAYIIEGTHHNPQDMAVRELSVKVGRPIFEALLKRLLQGPRVYGSVRDDAGGPVKAVTMVTSIRTFEGERWTSRAHDGRYDRVLPKPGQYTLRVEAEGYTPILIPFRAGKEPYRLDVVLTPNSVGESSSADKD